MAEISKIQRAVEMPDAKKKAFLNLIKTCNGVITKEGSLYTSKESAILNRDIEREMTKCSQLDSGLTKAVMLIFGRPNLDSIDYSKLNAMDSKDQGLIRELHGMLDEDKISEAITLSEELLESEDLPGVKGLLGKGIDDIKSHLQAFRPVWQAYQDHENPMNENGERVSIAEMQTRLNYNNRRIATLKEQIEMESDKLQRLIDRQTRLQEENAGIEELLGGETREKVEEVVGADVLQFPTKKSGTEAHLEGINIIPEGEQLVADMVSGKGVVKAIKKEAEGEDNVVPLRRGKEKNIPDDIA